MRAASGRNPNNVQTVDEFYGKVFGKSSEELNTLLTASADYLLEDIRITWLPMLPRVQWSVMDRLLQYFQESLACAYEILPRSYCLVRLETNSSFPEIMNTIVEIRMVMKRTFADIDEEVVIGLVVQAIMRHVFHKNSPLDHYVPASQRELEYTSHVVRNHPLPSELSLGSKLRSFN